MDAPLLQTKLYIPTTRAAPAMQHSSLIPRPRLIERLNAGLSGKITLISAPAGFGKTMILSGWLAHIKLPAAWLSLDEDDDDLGRFLQYLIAALRTIQPNVGTELLALLQSSPLPSTHTLLALLLNDLTALSQRSILVLDDYHTIESLAIDQALTYILDHIPPSLHLVISSRMDPNLPLAKLRAEGELNELRSADLRFTKAETAEFLAQMTGLHFNPDEMDALDRRAEGWVAGLQMAALSLQQREGTEVAHFIEDFSGTHRYIMDYLIDEVLQQQPAEVQTFLLLTSVLDRLNAPLCEALLRSEPVPNNNDSTPLTLPDAARAQELLDYLEQANLFITPLDDQRQWYRYHSLFADLLRHRLGQTYPQLVASLHLCASQWHEQAGLTGAAVRHALAARAFGRAALLVEQAAPAMIERSELTMLLTWLDMLPQHEVQARPLLALYSIRVLLILGQIHQAATRLKLLEATLQKDEAKRTPEVQAHLAAMHAYQAREAGNFDAMIAHFQKAIAHWPKQGSLLQAMDSLNLAIAHYLRGEFDLASPLLAEIVTIGQTAPPVASTLAAIYLYTRLLRAQGNLQAALQLCQEGLDWVARHNSRNIPAVGFLYMAYGELLREQNEISQAADFLERGIKLGQQGGHPHIMIIGYIWLAWLRQNQGDLDASQEAIRTVHQIVRHRELSHAWPVPSVACYEARLWLIQGNLAAANHWAQASGLAKQEAPFSYLYEREYLTLARLWLAQGRLEDAEALLRRLHQTATAAGHTGSLIEILALQAITFAAQMRSNEAMAALAQALGLAEPEGFVRIFLDEGAPMVELLRQAVAQKLHISFALDLLQALGEVEVSPQPLVEPLSERELEVLHRVAAGYSNQEIAQELVVAISTVKKHISNMYGKLAVANRTQAVARAREIGLL